MVVKEKVRDKERSKESENNQLVGEKETSKEQEKVKDWERSKESKSNQLTKRMGEKETDEGEDQKWAQFTEEQSQGGNILQAEAKTKGKIDIICHKEWLPPYASSRHVFGGLHDYFET